MKMAARPDDHQGGTRVHPPPASEAGQAASAGSVADAVQVVSVSKSYGHRRHRADALQDVTATAIFLGTGVTLSAPAQRLAGTTLVVTGNPDVRVHLGNRGQRGDRRAAATGLPDLARVG